MSKFKVGDKVKGTKQANGIYTITNEDMLLGEIIHIYEDRNGIDIKVLKHKDKEYEGEKVCCFCFNDSYFKLVQPKQFTKSDLKERWLVKTRDGHKAMFDGYDFKVIENGKFQYGLSSIKNYNDDLTSKANIPNAKDYDIMEVYKPHYSKVWEREEEPAPIEMSISEIKSKLGIGEDVDFKIVEEE